MPYTKSQEEKLAFIVRLNDAIMSGDESKIDQVFHKDFKFLVPGTNREVKEVPLPAGIAGTRFPNIYNSEIIRTQSYHCCMA